jgi:hypothetical protein
MLYEFSGRRPSVCAALSTLSLRLFSLPFAYLISAILFASSVRSPDFSPSSIWFIASYRDLTRLTNNFNCQFVMALLNNFPARILSIIIVFLSWTIAASTTADGLYSSRLSHITPIITRTAHNHTWSVAYPTPSSPAASIPLPALSFSSATNCTGGATTTTIYVRPTNCTASISFTEISLSSHSSHNWNQTTNSIIIGTGTTSYASEQSSASNINCTAPVISTPQGQPPVVPTTVVATPTTASKGLPTSAEPLFTAGAFKLADVKSTVVGSIVLGLGGMLL